MPIDFDALMKSEYGDDDSDEISPSSKAFTDSKESKDSKNRFAAPPVEECEFLEACQDLTGSPGLEGVFAKGLDRLKAAIDAGAKGTLKSANGFRGIDWIARGNSSPEAAAAVEFMADAGMVEVMMTAPKASLMPPMMAAAYAGNFDVVGKFLELGMPADTKFSAPTNGIIEGTAFHAAVLGYRFSRKEDYSSVLGALLTHCPEGIEVLDAMKQRPIDLAVKAATQTKDLTLITALMQFGVTTVSSSAASASSILMAMSDGYGDDSLRTLTAVSEARMAIRQIDEFRSTPKP